MTIPKLLPAGFPIPSAHHYQRDFGAITFTIWFRLECFAVYAISFVTAGNARLAT
ncbi:hypothetical protein [Photorhabdus stackebrandtii]|uniref:hypothetical protein n=1 Tax=Photorhabdus stackebrandtii TaxID=1123042 RepID=UPI00140C7069|nr:hypothetical protein [Photorhabdus stackebrandtii]